MSIKDISEKIKPYWAEQGIPFLLKIKSHLEVKGDVFIVLSIIFIGFAGFGLGKLSALEKSRGEVVIKKVNFTSDISSNVVPTVGIQNQSASAMVALESAQGLLVASKSGKKYHFPWCAGASQIAEKNKIWFNSYEEAQKAGYTAASNCKDLK